MKNIKIQLFILVIGLMLCFASFKGIKKYYYDTYKKKINYTLNYNNYDKMGFALSYIDDTSNTNVDLTIKEATTTIPIVTTTTTTTVQTTTTTSTAKSNDNELLIKPAVIDDGKIVYDGLTITSLTDKLNKNLKSTLTNTGYYFAKYFVETGLDPYLAVSIVLHETGCNWTCSSLVREKYNIGGLKSGGTYIKYNSLEEGIDGYLNILYNNYYAKGLTTPELIQSKYAPASETWTSKINYYINTIKAS